MAMRRPSCASPASWRRRGPGRTSARRSGAEARGWSEPGAMSSVFQAHCDAAAAASRPPGGCRHPGAVLAVTILASSLAFIDGSVVNVGLPAIAESLRAGAADLQWLVNGYLLPLSALLLLGGALGDRVGRRRVLVTGVILFALASLACTLAPGLAWLLAGRAVQGICAAMLLSNSPA